MSSKKNTSFYTLRNKIKLIKGGSHYFNLLKELIRKAEYSIFIRIYIWDDDVTGTQIADELIAAKQRGVSIFIVADGYASQCLSKGFIKHLRGYGIQFKYFEPLLKSSHFYFGRRMHEKLVVIDDVHAVVGGVNFADRYNDVDRVPAWLDYALYVQGEAAYELYQYCSSEWNIKARELFLPENLREENCSVRVRRNDWVKGKREIWKTYFNSFNHAEESITIMCSYFLPGSVLRSRLSQAVKRGVKVKVILAGPSDVMLAKYGERYLYEWMLKNGIEIYEYQPSVLHAKIMVTDNHRVTIGSFNVNNVSAYASMELNLDVRNRPFALSVQELMDEIIQNDCIQVKKKSFLPNIFTRLVQKTSYEIIRVILNLSTFYFKQE